MDSKDDDKPFLLVGTGSETVAPGLHILRGQGQSFVAETDAGLVVVDAGPGGSVTQGMIDSLRALSDAPCMRCATATATSATTPACPSGWSMRASAASPRPPHRPPQRAAPPRTLPRDQALQHRMAEVQFNRSPGFFERRLAMHEPTETFDQRLVIGSGEQRIELLWAPSETDDAIALWSPAQRVIYGGAALLDSIPNIGTPFRTLRDTVRWAGTLEALAALDPRIAVREFGPVIEGEAEVQKVLTHGPRAALAARRSGQPHEPGPGRAAGAGPDALPQELFGVPWMKPTYGDPSYIVRDIYRSENGWWDRNPTTLHPEPPEAVGAAVARAITDKPAVIASAQALADAGQWQLALHDRPAGHRPWRRARTRPGAPSRPPGCASARPRSPAMYRAISTRSAPT
jgi:uncharacterized sulfatase